MKTLKLIPHLDLEKISHNLAISTKAHTRYYWQIILSVFINPGKLASDYAAFLGVSTQKVYRTVQKYNKNGEKAFSSSWGGRRKEVAFLSIEEEKELLNSISHLAREGLVITMHDIRKEVIEKVGKKVSDDYIWDLFKRHNWKKKAPRPRHPKKDLQAHENFKKNFMIWYPPESGRK